LNYFIDKRLFDIDTDTSDIKGAYNMKQKLFAEERKEQQSMTSRSSNLDLDRINRIEDIEKFAHLFKFDDSLKEIKVKPKENSAVNQVDFSTNFIKVFLFKFKTSPSIILSRGKKFT